VNTSNHTYALVAGDFGSLFSFDGRSLTRIRVPTSENLTDVEWRHDTAYALVTGENGVLLKYDGNSVESVTTDAARGINFNSVAWAPDDSSALIVGTDHRGITMHGVLYKYTEDRVEKLHSVKYDGFQSVRYNPLNGSIALIIGVSSREYSHGIVVAYDGHDLKPVPSNTNDTLNTVAWSPDGQYALIGGNIHGLTINATLFRYAGGALSALSTSTCCFTNDAHGTRAISFSRDHSVALINGNRGLVIVYVHGQMARVRDYTNAYGRPEDLHHIGDFYSTSWVPGTTTAYTVGGNTTIARITDMYTVDLVYQSINGPTLRSISIVSRDPKLSSPSQQPLNVAPPVTVLQQLAHDLSLVQEPLLLGGFLTVLLFVMATAQVDRAKGVMEDQARDPVTMLNPTDPGPFSHASQIINPRISQGYRRLLNRLDWWGLPRKAWIIILSQACVSVALVGSTDWEYLNNLYLRYYLSSVGPSIARALSIVATIIIGLSIVQYFRTRLIHIRPKLVRTSRVERRHATWRVHLRLRRSRKQTEQVESRMVSDKKPMPDTGNITNLHRKIARHFSTRSLRRISAYLRRRIHNRS